MAELSGFFSLIMAAGSLIIKEKGLLERLVLAERSVASANRLSGHFRSAPPFLLNRSVLVERSGTRTLRFSKNH